MLYLIYFAILFVIILYLLFRETIDLTEVKRRYPILPGYPIFGNALKFRDPKKSLEIILNDTKIYGSIIFMKFFHLPYLMINEPKFIEHVLGSTKFIDKSDEYKLFGEWFGNGLLTGKGEHWKNHRKILTPSFHYKILEQFVEVFDRRSAILIKKLNQHVGKDSVDIFTPISLCTLDIICETAMGTSTNAQDDPNSEFVRCVREMCDLIFHRALTINRVDWIFKWTNDYKREQRVIKYMRDYSFNIIKKRKKALSTQREMAINETSEDIGLKRRFTFLDVLLLSEIDGKPIPLEDIREQVDTFMFEGHDTTSIGISFALYCLSKNLDVQEKAFEELKQIFGEDLTRSATYKDLQEMKYLELVIKETLRLYPPVAIFGRKLAQDTVFANIKLPKGLSIIFFPYVLHRQDKIFENPKKFIPERFTLENSASRHPYAYIPFSAGPRNCIGQKFAMLELKSTISKILRNYEVLPALPEYTARPMVKVTLESSNGIKIRLKRRS